MRKTLLPFVACDRKAAILRVQIWSVHESDVVGLGDGSIQVFPWSDTPFDHGAWQFGNCFRTHREAERAREVLWQVLWAFHSEHAR